MPNQLTCIGNNNRCLGITVFGLDGFDEVERRAGGNGFLAQDTVGKNAKILHRFAKVENQAFSGYEVGGGQDGDVGICGTCGERKAGDF